MLQSVPHVVDVDVAANLTQGLHVPSTLCVFQISSGWPCGPEVRVLQVLSKSTSRRPAGTSHKRDRTSDPGATLSRPQEVQMGNAAAWTQILNVLFAFFPPPCR